MVQEDEESCQNARYAHSRCRYCVDSADRQNGMEVCRNAPKGLEMGYLAGVGFSGYHTEKASFQISLNSSRNRIGVLQSMDCTILPIAGISVYYHTM